jgi:hypothetical protein
MNSIMERWIQTCRRELLDRTLIWNECHLLHALRVRDLLQPASASPCPRTSSPGPPLARTDHRTRPDHADGGPPARSTRRNPSRVPTCRLTRQNE